jgi:hypothetical protein
VLRRVTVGSTIGDKVHDGDRWIAVASIRIGWPLVSHESLFQHAPALRLITAAVL